jgi:hypothetical protein
MSGAGYQRVVLCCTACEHVFEPDLVAKLAETGCERCGGWTWIGELGGGTPPVLPAPRTASTHQSKQVRGEQ